MDYWHRDTVLRAYFEGKNWEENPEFKLKRRLVLDPPEELREFSFVVEDEWEVEAGQSREGRGDLVFTDGCGRYAVVEVKHLSYERTDRTAKRTRKERREHVQEQAKKYARAYCKRLDPWSDVEVRAYAATPEGLRCIARFEPTLGYNSWDEDFYFDPDA